MQIDKNNLENTIISEENEHLIVASENVSNNLKSISNKESSKTNKKEEKKKRKSLFDSIKSLYGVGDDKEEDLEFIYSSYANANEKPGNTSKIISILIIGIFLVFILWAALAEIDELARGNGKVIPTDKIQTVQSLDGGIISEIFIIKNVIDLGFVTNFISYITDRGKLICKYF